MARAIWKGALAFGMVNVPVGLYTATEQHEVRFRQLQRGTSSRIRYRRVNEDTGEEVDYGDIVKGAEVGDGSYVVVEPDELEQVEPGRSRTIEISDFVDATEIDPIHFQKSYFLAPREDSARKAYALLARAMEQADRIGVATFVMRNKEYLAAVRPREGMLVLETMFFADEVRNPAAEIDGLPVEESPRQRDLDTAVQLIEMMTTPWEPEKYHDTYTERVRELVEAKVNDEQVVTEERETKPAGRVVDLLDALRSSVERAEQSRSGDASPAPRAGGRRGDEPLADLSKAQLYKRAQQLGVPGRSSMSREQLLDAVRDAGQQRAAS